MTGILTNARHLVSIDTPAVDSGLGAASTEGHARGETEVVHHAINRSCATRRYALIERYPQFHPCHGMAMVVTRILA